MIKSFQKKKPVNDSDVGEHVSLFNPESWHPCPGEVNEV